MAMTLTTNSSSLTRPRPQAPGAPTSSPTIMGMMVKPEDPDIELKLDVLNCVLTLTSGVVVGLRIFHKYAQGSHLWWDDYIAIVSWMLLVGLAVTLSFEMRNGAGRHTPELDAPALRTFRAAGEVAATVAIAAASLAKTGFAATLLRAARGGWPRRAAWAVVALVNSAAAAAGVLVWVQCAPLRKSFEAAAGPGSCAPGPVRVAVQVVNSAVSGTADIALSLLALYIVHKSRVHQGYWIGALVCAALGIFAGITGFTKSAIMHVLDGEDVTFDAVMLIIWGAVEPATIIIAASLPELRGYVWRHPKPIRYRCEDSVHRRRGLTEEDYDYARRQYANAGRKTLGDRSESMEAVDVRHSAFWI